MSDRKPPMETGRKAEVSKPRSENSAIEAFVRQARALATIGKGNGRLILALDATMSRQPTWDLACEIQAEMFDAVGKAGALNVQLVYYRGFGECAASRFVTDTEALKKLMARIDCRGGRTQIGKILAHALKENARGKVNALVFIGDAMEEDVDLLSQRAGELGLKSVPVFVFQEGRDPSATGAFKEIARLSKGAWFRFDRNAGDVLAKLLGAVAVYATGGLPALEARGRPEDRMMIEHLSGKK
ncbi:MULTISPECIES: hypothetical protein [Chelativorans]|jgi:hypothetical protein|uniref:VWA domain-containing protein n=1 Tax=Chelativorans sp. (strain BNC1) TaxID=266779 RepID=Q11IL0_CHESB|nr:MULTISPECIES: hypothetical protein [Chelativorans]